MNVLLIFCIVLALLANVGARLLSPFKRLAVPGDPIVLAIKQADRQVRSVAWSETFIALEWLSIGVALSILMYDLG
jgi:hypothetical protein